VSDRERAYDQALEEALDIACLQLQVARTPGARRRAFRRLQRLAAKRRPERIAAMERERGLR